jgi:hypothetical protein
MRGDPEKKACPTWHGGVAHQPTAYNPVKQIAYGVGAEGCFTQNGAEFRFLSANGGLDRKNSDKRTYTSDLYYGAITAYDVTSGKVLAKTVTDIEIRSGATVTAGGLVFSAPGRLRRLRRREAAGAGRFQCGHAAERRTGGLRSNQRSSSGPASGRHSIR